MPPRSVAESYPQYESLCVDGCQAASAGRYRPPLRHTKSRRSFEITCDHVGALHAPTKPSTKHRLINYKF
jgi:hypothetical protein